MAERQAQLDTHLEDIRALVRAHAHNYYDAQLTFEACCLFFLAGHSLVELQTNIHRYFGGSSKAMMRALHRRAEEPGGNKQYLKGILDMMRVVVSEGLIYVADAHIKDESRPFAEGEQGMHARLLHAPIAWEMAHRKAGPGPQDWESVLKRADAVIDQEHAALRHDQRPSVNKLYLRLGALFPPMQKAGMFDGDASEQAAALRDASIFLTMMDVATLEAMLRGSCLFGMGAVDRNLLGFFNSPLCSESGTIDARLEEIIAGNKEFHDVIKSGKPYELLIGLGTKDGGQSYMITYDVTKLTDLSVKLPSSAYPINGVPAILEPGTLGGGFGFALEQFGYFRPAFNMDVPGTIYPATLLPGAQGLKARAEMVRTIMRNLFTKDDSQQLMAGREERWNAVRDGSDGTGVLLKGWTMLMRTATPVGGRYMHGTLSCKRSFEQ